MGEKDLIKLSKFLSLVLRHQPEIIHVKLDKNGWLDVDTLIQKSSEQGIVFDKVFLEKMVETNAKKRFTFNDTKDKIRANQGHSIDVDVELLSQKPPDILYHGTCEQFLDSILQSGLNKQERQHVHLSENIETVKQFGARHGKPVVLEVAAKQMFEEGYAFFLSKNGVWLTTEVPTTNLKINILKC